MTEPSMYVNELLGVRYWLLDETEPYQGKTRLLRQFGCSTTSGRRGWWHHGVNTSRCQNKEQALMEGREYPLHPGPSSHPAWKCSCGLHAYGSLSEHVYDTPSTPLQKIMGVVKMWGNIKTYRNLIRSQHAEIIAFFDYPKYNKKVNEYVMGLCVEHGYDLLDFNAYKDNSDALREYAEEKGLMLLEDIPQDDEV